MSPVKMECPDEDIPDGELEGLNGSALADVPCNALISVLLRCSECILLELGPHIVRSSMLIIGGKPYTGLGLGLTDS